jgi:hypothetical protein
MGDCRKLERRRYKVADLRFLRGSPFVDLETHMNVMKRVDKSNIELMYQVLNRKHALTCSVIAAWL